MTPVSIKSKIVLTRSSLIKGFFRNTVDLYRQISPSNSEQDDINIIGVNTAS